MISIDELGPHDEFRVLDLFLDCEADWNQLFEVPPTSNDYQSACSMIPDGPTLGPKVILGLSEGERLLAYLDVVRDRPVVGIATVGFVLVRPASRKHGYARRLLRNCGDRYSIDLVQLLYHPHAVGVISALFEVVE